MRYTCPDCGGTIKYAPERKAVICTQCEKELTSEELEVDDEHDDIGKIFLGGLSDEEGTKVLNNGLNADEIKSFEAGVARGEWDDSAKGYMDLNVYECTACGAQLMVDRNETSTFCAYCGQPTVVFNRVSKELQPDYCIPFQVSGEEAVKLIKSRLRKGIFVPKSIKNVQIDKLRGIYIPFWLHDVKVREKANIRGTRGSGKHKRTVHFYRDAECTYSKITSDASKKLNDELSQRLEPYEKEGLRPFQPQYLAGFYADRYDVEESETRQIAFRRALEFIEDDILDSCNASNKSIQEKNNEVHILKSEYALLPAWFMTFWYKNELYTILVNGQTGKVVGNVPVDKLKVGIFFAILTVVSCTISSGLMNKLFNSVIGSDDAMESVFKLIIFIIIFVIILTVIAATTITKFIKDRKRFKESNTVEYVKERQDNLWEE